jgi:hypothetical protein
MQTSLTISEIAKALCAFQGEVKPVPKESVNPFFKSKYADLSSIISHIQPTLKKNGLSVAQLNNEADGKVSVTTILMHNSGEWLSGTITMNPSKSDPQTYLSTLTYSRRGALSAILGLATEDDTDGAVASGKTVTEVSKPKLDLKVAPKTTSKVVENVEKKPVEAVKTAKVLDDKPTVVAEDSKSFSEEMKTALNLNHLKTVWQAIMDAHKNKTISDSELAELTKVKDARKVELK